MFETRIHVQETQDAKIDTPTLPCFSRLSQLHESNHWSILDDITSLIEVVK